MNILIRNRRENKSENKSKGTLTPSPPSPPQPSLSGSKSEPTAKGLKGPGDTLECSHLSKKAESQD